MSEHAKSSTALQYIFGFLNEHTVRRTRKCAHNLSPKNRKGFLFACGAVGYIQVKNLNITSSIQHCITTERCTEVMRGLFDPTHVGTVQYMYVIRKITVEFWKLRHVARETFLTLHCLGRVRCQSRDDVNCRWGRCEEGQNTKRAEGIVSAFVKARAWNATRVCFRSTHSLSSRFDAKRWYVWTLPN